MSVAKKPAALRRVRPGLERVPFGRLPDGSRASLYTLTNAAGARLQLSDYGCTVVSLEAPDRQGRLLDVVLGCGSLEDYLRHSPCFGSTVGRVANRIAGASFRLAGRTWRLPANVGAHCLHGGLRGFDKALWKAEPRMTPEGPAVLLSYLSRDGEEGFPGNLRVKALHTWTHDHCLRIDYSATTDAPTVVSLTHHSYFNLADGGRTPALDHWLMLPADAITEVGEGIVPTGRLMPVKGTPLDFRLPRRVGERIAARDGQLDLAGGYDHNWVLNKRPGALGLAARLWEPASGRLVECHTTAPGLQFYAGNGLGGTFRGKGGVAYPRRSGLCLEPQLFPDAPNQPHFPSARLDPGQVYRHSLAYRFSAW